MTAPLQRLIGQVEAANEKGVKVDGAWHNYSRFSKPEELAPVQAGVWAELAIDGSGFVRSVATNAPDDPVPDEPPDEPVEEVPERAYHEPSKDTLIVRQTCLRGAVDFAASRDEIKSADVLKLACAFERWIWRSA